MGISILVPPATLPVTLDEAKRQVGIAAGLVAQDDDITRRISGATNVAERFTKRAFITRQYLLTFGRWPYEIGLPFPPLISIDSIKYVDSDGILQTLDPLVYQSTNRATPGILRPAFNQVWPIIRPLTLDPIQVTYTAGYGNAPEDCPDEAREAILVMAATWFNNREEVIDGNMSQVPLSATYLLQSLQYGRYPGWYDPLFAEAYSVVRQ